MKLEEKYNQLRALHQYKKLSDSEVLDIAKEKLAPISSHNTSDIAIPFKDKKERKLTEALIKKYFEDFMIETISDKNTLKEIIYLEVIQTRLHEKLNEAYETKVKALPLQMLEAIQKNSDAIIKLKSTLGLHKGKEEKKDSYDVLEHLKERAKHWRENNVASRQAICPHCSNMILFKIRVDKYDAIKHPFFKDKTLFNEHLLYLYLNGKLTRADVALVLGSSEDYVDWLVNKMWKTNEKYAIIKGKSDEASKPTTEETVQAEEKPEAPKDEKKL